MTCLKLQTGVTEFLEFFLPRTLEIRRGWTPIFSESSFALRAPMVESLAIAT
jgi:hypothetical protein